MADPGSETRLLDVLGRVVRRLSRLSGGLEDTPALTATQRLVAEADFYGRRFATGVVTPALRAQGFRITGQTL